MFSAIRARAVLVCLAILTAPLQHFAFAHGRFVAAAIGAGAIQAGVVAWLVTGGGRIDRFPAVRFAVSAAAAAGMVSVGSWAGGASVGAVAGLSHAALHCTLLAVFGGSLRQGRTPVVTVIARAARGTLPAPVVRYTRAVTWVWAGFAAAQLLASALLLLFAPAAVWSLFVNGLDLPAMLVLFAGEYAVRRYRFPDLPRLSREQSLRAAAASMSIRTMTEPT